MNSEENPADCASRGIFASEIIHNVLWWSGPIWLQSSNCKRNSVIDFNENALVEEKAMICHNIIVEEEPYSYIFIE